MARQTPCIPAQPIYSSTSPCNRQEVSENRGREFYMGLMYTVLVLTDFFCHIFYESLFSGTVLQLDTRTPLVVYPCLLGNIAKTARMSDDIDAWWMMGKGVPIFARCPEQMNCSSEGDAREMRSWEKMRGKLALRVPVGKPDPCQAKGLVYWRLKEEREALLLSLSLSLYTKAKNVV